MHPAKHFLLSGEQYHTACKIQHHQAVDYCNSDKFSSELKSFPYHAVLILIEIDVVGINPAVVIAVIRIPAFIPKDTVRIITGLRSNMPCVLYVMLHFISAVAVYICSCNAVYASTVGVDLTAHSEVAVIVRRGTEFYTLCGTPITVNHIPVLVCIGADFTGVRYIDRSTYTENGVCLLLGLI